jgi:hypothetical protein
MNSVEYSVEVDGIEQWTVRQKLLRTAANNLGLNLDGLSKREARETAAALGFLPFKLFVRGTAI